MSAAVLPTPVAGYDAAVLRHALRQAAGVCGGGRVDRTGFLLRGAQIGAFGKDAATGRAVPPFRRARAPTGFLMPPLRFSQSITASRCEAWIWSLN